jgi:hypothetical protein
VPLRLVEGASYRGIQQTCHVSSDLFANVVGQFRTGGMVAVFAAEQFFPIENDPRLPRRLNHSRRCGGGVLKEQDLPERHRRNWQSGR